MGESSSVVILSQLVIPSEGDAFSSPSSKPSESLLHAPAEPRDPPSIKSWTPPPSPPPPTTVRSSSGQSLRVELPGDVSDPMVNQLTPELSPVPVPYFEDTLDENDVVNDNAEVSDGVAAGSERETVDDGNHPPVRFVEDDDDPLEDLFPPILATPTHHRSATNGVRTPPDGGVSESFEEDETIRLVLEPHEEASRTTTTPSSVPRRKTDGVRATSVSPPSLHQVPSDQRHRRVTFAGITSSGGKDDDDVDGRNKCSMVTSYLEPPDPWRSRRGCTAEILKAAYLSACDELSIKPMGRIVEQILCVNDFTNRHDLFTMKSERLDARHVETLEEIFRRVQFRNVDFESCGLDDDVLISLCDMMEYYESVERLNISHNRSVGPRGWQACAKLIRKTPCLEAVDVRGCNFSEQLMPIMGRALRPNTSLSVLHMESCQLAGKPLLILVAALKMNETLRELYLSDNRLQSTDAIQLGNLLKYNHTLRLLDVRNNHLHDAGVDHVSDGLREQYLTNQGLTTLVLWNNQVTYQGMTKLSLALAAVKNLETLNLGFNNVTNEGVHRLKDGLLKNRSILRLGMQCTKVTCEGAVALAEVIADSSRLIRLDLRENEIKSGGLMALALSLKMNSSVTRLDLDVSAKREPMKDYAVQQQKLYEDVMNYCQRNRDAAVRRDDEQLRKMLAERVQEQQRHEGTVEDKTLPATEDTTSTITTKTETTEIPSVDEEAAPARRLGLVQATATENLDSPVIGDEEPLPLAPSPVPCNATETSETTTNDGIKEVEKVVSDVSSKSYGHTDNPSFLVTAPAEEISLSSITWPSPTSPAAPPTELPLKVATHNTITTYHSSPVSPLLSPSVPAAMSVVKASSTSNLEPPHKNRFRRFQVQKVADSSLAFLGNSSSSSSESSPCPSPVPSVLSSKNVAVTEKTSMTPTSSSTSQLSSSSDFPSVSLTTVPSTTEISSSSPFVEQSSSAPSDRNSIRDVGSSADHDSLLVVAGETPIGAVTRDSDLERDDPRPERNSLLDQSNLASVDIRAPVTVCDTTSTVTHDSSPKPESSSDRCAAAAGRDELRPASTESLAGSDASAVDDLFQNHNDSLKIACVEDEFERRIGEMNLLDDEVEKILQEKLTDVSASPPSTSESIDSDVFDSSLSLPHSCDATPTSDVERRIRDADDPVPLPVHASISSIDEAESAAASLASAVEDASTTAGVDSHSPFVDSKGAVTLEQRIVAHDLPESSVASTNDSGICDVEISRSPDLALF